MDLVTKTLILLPSIGLIAGCAHTSVYEEVASEITAKSDHIVHYAATWSPLGISPGGASPQETNQAFLNVLDRCAERLEGQKHEFMGRRHPSKAMATIQLLGCVNDNNWIIEIVEEIILVD
jgi:hypothetical protein